MPLDELVKECEMAESQASTDTEDFSECEEDENCEEDPELAAMLDPKKSESGAVAMVPGRIFLAENFRDPTFLDSLKSAMEYRIKKLKRSKKLDKLEFFKSYRKTSEQETFYETNTTMGSSKFYQSKRDEEAFNETPHLSFHPYLQSSLQAQSLPMYSYPMPSYHLEPMSQQRYRYKVREYEMECVDHNVQGQYPTQREIVPYGFPFPAPPQMIVPKSTNCQPKRRNSRHDIPRNNRGGE